MSIESARELWSLLAEASVRAAAAAALAAAILFATRTRAAAVRHAVWTGVTAAMLAMPLLPRAVPPLSVGTLPSLDLWTAVGPARQSVPGPDDRDAQRRDGRHVPIANASTTGTTAPTTTRRAAPRAAVRWTWPAAAAIIYFAGLFASLVYVAAGWVAMSAVVRRAGRITLPDGGAALECDVVAAPLTAGVFAASIVLPASWRGWADETLRAVVAHERTHIRRRDPLVALLARLNRCVFWFHPLAWWLEAKLAASAEYACDEAASRACPRDVYARALLEIAADVRRSGGRIAWPGIGASGNGRLADRIERILSESPWPSMSRRGKIGVATACVAAVAIAAACRPAVQAKPLQPDPAVTAREAQERARQERWRAARSMSAPDVARLESAVAQNPADLDARDRLLLYYGDPNRTLDAAAVAARRAHVLWTIEHHPGSELAANSGMRIYTTNQDRNPDPEGYVQAKRLWQAQTAREDAPTAAFVNAAHFFEVADKPLAEANYLKAQAREPGKYSGALGRLYALTIMGSDASMPLNVLRHVSMAQAHGPYADRVRQTLATTSDTALLTSAAHYLMNARQFNTMGQTAGSIDFDVELEGVKHLERALQVDPDNVGAAALLARQHYFDQHERVYARFGPRLREMTPEQVAALPETDRLDLLADLISASYSRGERLTNENDADGAKAAWQRSKAYANDALALARRHPEHPNAGVVEFDAHMCLGTLALWDGDVKTALSHLKAAPDAPASDRLKYGGGISMGSYRLVRYLLKAGEYDAVAAFYDRMATVDKVQGQYYAESAQAIRAGRMPSWYQVTEQREAGSGKR